MVKSIDFIIDESGTIVHNKAGHRVCHTQFFRRAFKLFLREVGEVEGSGPVSGNVGLEWLGIMRVSLELQVRGTMRSNWA